MDLRQFYQKMRKVEQGIAEPHVIVVSLDTPDGGKSGVMTEVQRELAAKLMVEQRVRLATPAESEAFYKSVREGCREREREIAASRLRVNVLSDDELASLRKPSWKQE